MTPINTFWWCVCICLSTLQCPFKSRKWRHCSQKSPIRNTVPYLTFSKTRGELTRISYLYSTCKCFMWKKTSFWKTSLDRLSTVLFKIFGENPKIFLIKPISLEMNRDVTRSTRAVRETRKLYENCGRLQHLIDICTNLILKASERNSQTWQSNKSYHV